MQSKRTLNIPAEAQRYTDLDLRAFYLPHAPPPDLRLHTHNRWSRTQNVVEKIERDVLTNVLTTQLRRRKASWSKTAVR